VLLLEAGREDSNPWIHIPLGYGKHFTNPAVNWLYTSEPQSGAANRRIAQPRGKVLGGSTSINGLLYIRGQREDYDRWRDLGNARSPSRTAASWTRSGRERRSTAVSSAGTDDRALLMASRSAAVPLYLAA
jgi:choline dehydrogenase-like flavoprotein